MILASLLLSSVAFFLARHALNSTAVDDNLLSDGLQNAECLISVVCVDASSLTVLSLRSQFFHVSILSLHLLSDIPHVVDSALCSLGMQKWIFSSDCGDPSDCAHQSMSPASSTLYMLPLLLPFVLLLPFHVGVLQSLCLFWPCRVWDMPLSPCRYLHLPFLFPQLFQLFLRASHPSVCIFACLAAFLILPRSTICPAVVLFVVRAISAVVITFTTVPAYSLLSFAITFSELMDHGKYLILGDLIIHLFAFPRVLLDSPLLNV